MSIEAERIPVAGEATVAAAAPDAPATAAACCAPLGARRLDEGAAVELAGLLKALADPVRLQLVSIVATATAGEVCACDLPDLVDRSQPTVSHHLTQLVRAGLLAREQRGRWAWFRIRPEGFAALRAVLTDDIAADVPTR